MRKALAYAWQLPQNLLGLLLSKVYRIIETFELDGVQVHTTRSIFGGLSLGDHMFIRPKASGAVDSLDIRHEYGHCLQSRRLGWLYLPTVGLVSGIRAGLGLYRRGHYYDCWPENWADKLGGITIKDGRRHV